VGTATRHTGRRHPVTVDADAVPEGALALVRLRGDDWTASIGGATEPGDRMIVLEPVTARDSSTVSATDDESHGSRAAGLH